MENHQNFQMLQNDKIIVKGDERVQKGKMRFIDCNIKLIDHFLSK